ncbi:tRNA pseudouridine(55) synthase [Synechococcus sp. RS9909]|uniref:tRNA pseudouridine(55) synthase TruB n=1 Tax=unclassified Synechococcus TaxID=2626047 RepID=UPI000068F5E5|nr:MULTISPECIES: tRNA pseudouridine(55) synthase TruB [unclassified Synechococcus]EAQ69479.1 tRNA pseudouridine synthase B [Synechococcus sp. RS9917]QNI80253.1 tRNA pseudouridine(55) synthase [Synechococcus sp. RS9909]
MNREGANPIGFVVIDKPSGLTSHACVARLRRCLGTRRVGHGGTLDPAVTGVLPLAVGPATRLLPYLPGAKTYVGSIQLGRRTSSDDLDGDLLEERPWPRLSHADLNQRLDAFRGTIQQRPPQVSAVHVDGVRAHARARRGETMDLPPREVRIDRLTLLDWDPDSGELALEVHCSAGTYIRSLARDLGEQLGCGGCLARLRRLQALGFSIDQAAPLPLDATSATPPLIAPQLALQDHPTRITTAAELEDWRCGRRLSLDPDIAAGPVVVLAPDGQMLGLGLHEPPGSLRPKVVFDAQG